MLTRSFAMDGSDPRANARSDLRSPPALRLEPQVSRLLMAFLLSSHGLALAVTWLLPISFGLVASLVFIVILSFALSWRRHVLRSGAVAVIEAARDRDGAWRLRFADGREVGAELLGDSYVSSWLVVLNFRIGHWRAASLLLPRDSLPEETSRQLRVVLRRVPLE